MLKKQSFQTAGIVITLFALLFTAGCSKDDNNNTQKTTYTLSGNVNGSQEVPTVNTPASGTIAGTYNSSSNALTYSVTWTNLSGAPILMHFHGPALAGENASPTLDITGFPTTASGTYSGSATLSEAQEADLLGGKWYYNIHTVANGSGEIRGQVVVQ